MKNINDYLEKKGYKTNTKRTYKRYIQQFLSWFEIKNKSVLEVKYQDILEFIKSRKERKESTRFINSQLGVLRMYCYGCFNKRKGVDLRGERQRQRVDCPGFAPSEFARG